ncbi:hypothetical protein DCF83_17825 (plasmid) [Edwardsiella tarda]|uniref:hypothetical protein n=1 Tax=Edwardsiella tarda TaxID=636 RepID=UPI0011B1D2B0|nr:hypothetical protein [Edwardsiella tarda]UCQ29533.1 hypothetical protein DCF83_17825 [Edwardsiella tarda]
MFNAFAWGSFCVKNMFNPSPWGLFFRDVIIVFICNTMTIVVIGFILNDGVNSGATGRAIGVAFIVLALLFAKINLILALMLLVSLVKKWRTLSKWKKIIGVIIICCISFPGLLVSLGMGYAWLC